jgi:CDP-diglyceride synthetase
VFSLVFGRGIFSSLLHLISTGLIALLLFKLYQQASLKTLSLMKKILRVMICLLAGVLLHVGYNIASEYSQVWVYVVLVIGGYFLLTYILFLSDQLYRE